jgi:hypothetical protein
MAAAGRIGNDNADTGAATMDKEGVGAAKLLVINEGAERLPLRDGAIGETIPPSVGITEIPEDPPVIPIVTRVWAALGEASEAQVRRAIIGFNFMNSSA